MLRLVGLVLILGCARPPTPPTEAKTGETTLFFTSELKGTIEPCGCTSDPLGDLARTAALVKGNALFDGGSTLYTARPVPPDRRAQEALKAQILAETLPKLGLWASGLGPYDLPLGEAGVLYPRQAINAKGANTAPPFVRAMGGVKIGVFGVVDVEGVEATDPTPAAREAIASLRKQGAEIVIALAQMPRAAAKRLAQAAPGADFVLVGAGLDAMGLPEAEAVSGSYLLVPGDQGQSVLKVSLHYRGGKLVDAIGPARAVAEGQKLEGRIAALKTDLSRWEEDRDADPGFLQQNRDELARLEKERAELSASPLRTPAEGSWFVLERILIKKSLPCDPDVVAVKRRYDDAVGELNRRAAAEENPSPVPSGKAGYVGMEECTFCHQKAVTFWQSTHHAQAWATLENIHKQWNRDCVGCHVAAWLEPGGSVFGNVDRFKNVQCEVCHGPGSLHVDSDGKRRETLTRQPPAGFCAGRCHTPEHSDTFQYEAYLRDVLGPGHGEKLRTRLGAGPTGGELRRAALEKAGRGVGANCPE